MPAARRRLAAVPEAPGRAVLYVRVSALMGREGETFRSPDLQVSAIRRDPRVAAMREVDTVYDIDVTGTTFSREGLDKIRAMAEAGQMTVVAVYDLSRLGRNVREALAFIQWLEDRGVSIISTVEKIDDSPEGRFFLTQFLGMAQLYSDQMGRRWAEVIAARARQGGHHGAAPLGYRRENGELVIDPVVGPAIAKAFRDFAADVPVRQIALEISRVRGRRTDITTVKRALGNPTYRGQVVIWGMDQRRRPKYSDSPIYIGPGRHEALVDEQTWGKCVERHQLDSRTPPRRRVPTNPLSGIVLCAHCERPMQLHTHRRGQRYEPRLECATATNAGECHGAGHPRLEETVDAILDKIRERITLLRVDPVAQAAAVGKTARAGADVARLKRELADTHAAMGKLATGWASNKVPQAAYEAAMAPLEAAERELEDQLRKAETGSQQPAPLEIANLAERLLAMWPKATVPEKNRALKQVVRCARIRQAERYREPVADRLAVNFW